ncbi:MAG: CBS domain-containing protein [Polyangiaceae bacterium]
MPKISEIMTEDVIALPSSSSVQAAAEKMRDADVGVIVVKDGDKVCGLVTDRDITVRASAEGLDPAMTPLSAICSKDLASLSPDDDIDRAIGLMRERAVRRAPVVVEEHVIGIVSLGDLAIERDPDSVLGAISSAAPSR